MTDISHLHEPWLRRCGPVHGVKIQGRGDGSTRAERHFRAIGRNCLWGEHPIARGEAGVIVRWRIRKIGQNDKTNMMTTNNAVAAVFQSRAEAEAAVKERHGLNRPCP